MSKQNARFKKTVATEKGAIELIAQRHGIGWRVTACLMVLGVAHTEWAENIDDAASKAMTAVLNWS
jgi:hypothetical protein